MAKSHVAGWASDSPTPAQLSEFFGQIKSGRVTKDRLQEFLRGKVVGDLIVADDGSVRLRTEVDRDRTDEELVAEAKAAGWWVNGSIQTARRIDFSGRTERSGIEEVTMEVPKTIPDGEVWATKKVLGAIGQEGLNFDLVDLVKFIPHRDKLMEAGVRFIIVFGVRFRDGNGNECVACLSLEDRNVNLYYFENDWNDYARFGRSCK